MNPDPKPSRGMPRSIIYALIPGGFLVLILVLVLTGFWTQDETSDAPTIVDDERSVEEQADPPPSQ